MHQKMHDLKSYISYMWEIYRNIGRFHWKSSELQVWNWNFAFTCIQIWHDNGKWSHLILFSVNILVSFSHKFIIWFQRTAQVIWATCMILYSVFWARKYSSPFFHMEKRTQGICKITVFDRRKRVMGLELHEDLHLGDLSL